MRTIPRVPAPSSRSKIDPRASGCVFGALSSGLAPPLTDSSFMVRLNRIYTKTGDDGSTALGDGTRLPKHHLRVASYGEVDELSSVLGLALVNGLGEPMAVQVRQIQNDLFDVGADLCLPGEEGDGLRVPDAYVERIEGWIDAANESLEPLKSFVLPGGNPVAAWLHLGRTVCRRAERNVVALAEAMSDEQPLNPVVVQYLNRLSDLLFVLARCANDGGRADVLWVPGQAK